MRRFSSSSVVQTPSVAPLYINLKAIQSPPLDGSKTPSANLEPPDKSEDSESVMHSFDLGNEQPLMISAIIEHKIKASTMVDSGASTSFIDESFINAHSLIPRLKNFPEIVRVVDGRQSSSGRITHEIDLSLEIGNHSEILTFQVTRIARYNIILGKSWLSKHDPEIKWSSNTLSFKSRLCRQHCVDHSHYRSRSPSGSLGIKERTSSPSISDSSSTQSFHTAEINHPPEIYPISVTALHKYSKRPEYQLFSAPSKTSRNF